MLSKYVLQQLIRDELITGNPLTGMSIDLSSGKTRKPRADRALTRAELSKAIDWLLAQDPADAPRPRRGRWIEIAAAKRRNLIDLALLQAATGLRVGEANALTWDEFDEAADVRKSKTGRGRRVPLLFDDVTAHLAKRKQLGGRYVIGSPSDPNQEWDRDVCRKACAEFYPEIGAAIECPEVFEHGRTHLWRATLNTLLLNSVPDQIRAAYFGHDPATNAKYYTDTTDVGPLVEAAKTLRG